MEWEKNSIDDETQRQILLIETAAGFADKSEKAEKYRQFLILQAQADGAEKYLKKLEESGENQTSLTYLNALKAAQAARNAANEAGKNLGKNPDFDMFDLFGMGDMDPEKQKFIEQTAKQFLNDMSAVADGMIEQYQRQIDKKQEVIDQYNNEIDDLEDRLDKEKELRENGFANNVDLLEQELIAKKAARDEEIRQQEELQKKQIQLQKAKMAADTAIQLVGMITASVNIFEKSTEWFGPWGIPIAIAAIAAMFGAFAFAKVKAFQSINDSQKFRDGGWIDGNSHEAGGVKYYSPDGSIKELEGGEFVVRKKYAKKYSKLAEAINNDEVAKLSVKELSEMGILSKLTANEIMENKLFDVSNFTTRDILAMGLLEALGLGITPDLLFDDIEKSNNRSNEISSFSMVVESSSNEMKRIDKNLQFLVDSKKNETDRWEDDDYFYTKKGTKITKIPKK